MKIGVDLGAADGDLTVYTINGKHYPVRPRYYLASCDGCGWIGSSEECSSTIDDDVICPQCYSPGADCGKIARLGDEAERVTTIRRKSST